MPIREDESELVLAMVDPTDQFTIEAFQMVTGRTIRPMIALPNELDAALERLHGGNKSALGQIVDGVETRVVDEDGHVRRHPAAEGPRVRSAGHPPGEPDHHQRASSSARRTSTSSRSRTGSIVRYRIDGVLHEVESPPKRIVGAGDLAHQDHGQPRHRRAPPAAGRTHPAAAAGQGDRPARLDGADDCTARASCCAFSTRSGVALDCDELGFDAGPARSLRRSCSSRRTASCSSPARPAPARRRRCTRRSTCSNQPDVKILTVEDPVEYQLAGVNQIQVKPQIGLTFANALRSILRQDPDIIMVGEIRDLGDGADRDPGGADRPPRALDAAHQRRAGALTRLLDMGVEDYLLTSTVVGIQAQRLVRTLCHECREPYVPLPEVVEQMGLTRFAGIAALTLYHARGCDHCSHTGYIGRMCIMEIMPMTDTIRTLVMRHATATDLRAAAIEQGMHDDVRPRSAQGVAGRSRRSRKSCASPAMTDAMPTDA